MALYDFACKFGHTTELIRSQAVHLVDCPVCGGPAVRSEVNRGIGIVGPTTDTRGMFRRFQTATQEMDYAASKIEASTGLPVQTPNLWQAAKREHQARVRANEPIATQRAE